MVEHGAENTIERGLRLDDPPIVGHGCPQALTLAGEPHRQGAAHAESDHAVDVAFDERSRIQEFATGIDVLECE